jgi:hypothetical protein
VAEPCRSPLLAGRFVEISGSLLDTRLVTILTPVKTAHVRAGLLFFQTVRQRLNHRDLNLGPVPTFNIQITIGVLETNCSAGLNLRMRECGLLCERDGMMRTR